MIIRYVLTRDENVTLARRDVVDSIWREARLEGVTATFPQTVQVYDGLAAQGMSVDDVVTINNLKHAWQFVLDTLDVPCDLMYLRQLNKTIREGLAGDAGQVRGYDVRMGGTTWVPELPTPQSVRLLSSQIQELVGRDGALRSFARLARAQLFSDGNMRVAQLVANKKLIESGSGTFSVPVEEIPTFQGRLLLWYETADEDSFVRYLGESCVQTIHRRVTIEQPELPGEAWFVRRAAEIRRERERRDDDRER